MKLLLVNTNRFKTPPAVPVGLEYLITALENASHKLEILDLCFSNEPYKDLRSKILSKAPDIVLLSFRVLDTVLYHNNQCFIGDLLKLVQITHRLNKLVILGGAGFSCMPQEIMEYTKADFGIIGPGEIALPKLLQELEHSKMPKPEECSKLIDGYAAGILPDITHKRGKSFNYLQYIKAGGILGFSSHTGCPEGCIFCPEAKTRVFYRNPKAVASEIKYIMYQGYREFHLCDSEFNTDLNYCIKLCDELKLKAPGMRWTAYVKYQPFNPEFFKALKNAGCHMVTLSLETDPGKPYTFQRLANFFSFADNAGVNVFVDLLTGFPNEKYEDAQILINFLKTQPIAKVGVNNYIRIYPDGKLLKIIEADPGLTKHLIGYKSKTDFICPVFFNWFSDIQVQALIGNAKNIYLASNQKACNYQQIKPPKQEKETKIIRRKL
ncbi:MAG: cobalamin-dependent protein [bacterium]